MNTASLSSRYEALFVLGRIKDDPAQRQILAALQQLADSLVQPRRAGRWWRKPVAPPIRGLYIWGNVGRGKSMLMDLFFEQASVEKKRRIHFHAFMQEIHARMHQLRQEGLDPIAELVHELSQETRLLCFDELQATDVTDATLLFRLFKGLLDAGVTIVSTSNHPPASLYTGGIQRERFAKFIGLIESHMQVMALSSPSDYRQGQIKSLERTYFTPLGEAADAFIANVLERLCENPNPVQDTLSVHGRLTHFKRYDQSIGYFTFHELCETALGSADYLALAKRLKTVILTGIPLLTPEKRNEAKRFVTLIDVLYEHKIKLICTAAAPAQQLYPEGDGSFEFSRTVSRLAEMQSIGYLQG